jgi:dimethylaniline monooxygenase (N-oxide forming)
MPYLIIASQMKSYHIPEDHPLRLTRSMFWEGRTNDEGVRRDDSFHSLVLKGKINVKGGVRVVGWRSQDPVEDVPGRDSKLRTKTDTDEAYLLLSDGDKLYPGAVVLCTGYTSSWDAVFDGTVLSACFHLAYHCLKRPNQNVHNGRLG